MTGCRIARGAGAFAAFVGASVLVGWAVGVEAIVGLLPGLATMKPNTALGFLLAGAALWLRCSKGRTAVRLDRTASIAVTTLGLASLSQDVFGWDLGLDHVVHTSRFLVPAGRMAPATAASFALIGTALLSERLRRPLALVVGGAAVVALLGHAYGVEALYRVRPYSSVALHTALSFAVLTVGLLAVRLEHGPLSVLASESPAATVVRRFLAAALLFPPLLGALEVAGERAGLFGAGFGLAVLVATCMGLFGGLIYGSARELLRAEAEHSHSRGELRQSEDRFFKAFRASPAAMTISTADEGRYLQVNESFLRLIGLREADVVGRTAVDLGYWADASQRKRLVEGLRRGSVRDLPVTIRRSSGEHREILLSAELLELEAQECVLALSFDVTDLRRTESALRESRSLLERAQEVARVGSWTMGLEPDSPVTWSKETHRIFGTDESTFTPSVAAFRDLVHPDDRERFWQVWSASLSENKPYSLDHRIVRPDGGVRWLHGEAVLVRDEAGRPTKMLGTVQDVTQHRHLEEQLLQSQKMEAVGRLAGGVAHDFNNLLSIIIGYGSRVLQLVGEDDRLRPKLLEIQKAAERAAALTHQLLAFSRRQALVQEVLDLPEVVGDLLQMLRRLIGEDLQLETVLPFGSGRVLADRTQIQQVVMNLAVNARDAMPQGGCLVIEVREVDIDDSYAHRHPGMQSGPHVMLAVSDTGAGMDEATRSHVFEPFFTTKPLGQGTGLGLATVYGIVKQSGGFIWVYSERGHGTTFKIYLPRAEGAADPGPKAADPAVAPRGSETILLVEDEEGVRRLTREILEESGYRVLAAGNAQQGLELAAAEAGGAIDLVLTDVVMPGLNGRELARRVTVHHPGVKVLFMSGYTDDAIAHHGVIDAGVAFIGKPFTPGSLAHKIRSVLDAG